MIRLGHVEVPYETADRVKAMLLHGIIGQSEVIEEFEEAFARWIGSKYCVAVSSGTMADTIALAVLKHFNPGKNEVILPALTFIAQANAVVHNGLKPVFVDVDQYMNMDMSAAIHDKANMRTLCFFPTHLLGRPIAPLPVSNFRNIPVIEDACEAMGSLGYVDGKCGTFGLMGTFSFFPSHTITTGEGGMIVTNNKECADLARRLRNHGKISSHDFHFDVIGFNAKITSIQAAIGLGMLKTIDDVIEKRRRAYFALGGKDVEHHGRISPHALPVICESEEARDKMLCDLRAADIECRNLFSCIPTQEKAYAYLGHKPGEFPSAEDIGRRGLYVPCHSGLSNEDIEKIKGAIFEAQPGRA